MVSMTVRGTKRAGEEGVQVSHDGTLVRGVDGVAEATVRTVDGVVPFRGDGGTSRDGDDSTRDGLTVWVDTTVASHVGQEDILNGLAGNMR
jgi:hypothetical protein